MFVKLLYYGVWLCVLYFMFYLCGLIEDSMMGVLLFLKLYCFMGVIIIYKRI